MARSGWSNSNYLGYAAGLLTAAPLTMACWGKTSLTGAAQFMMDLHNNANIQNRNQIDLRVSAGNAVSIGIGDASAITQATAGTISANTWFHAAGVYASATSYTAYKDGTAGTTATTSRTPSGINRTWVGVSDSSGTPANAFALAGTGLIAWPAIWNIALSATDIAALAAGADPRLIHPEALVAFWPLNGEFSPEPNLLSNTSVMSITGALSQADGPQSLFGAD